MTFRYLMALAIFCCLAPLSAQPMFTNQSGLLQDGGTVAGSVAMAVVDMNGDGLDDIVRFDDGIQLRIETQQASGAFSSWFYPEIFDEPVWSVAVTDIEGDGLREIALGGWMYTELLKANNVSGSYNFTAKPVTPPITLLQGSNFAPITGGASVEYFACDDNELSKAFFINGDGSLIYAPSLINPVSSVPSDNSGNYASVWTDFDNDGNIDMYLSKCRINVSDELDGRRINQMWHNDGNGNFTDVAEAIGLRPLAQSWAADFADIDNDGDLDCFIVNHDKSSALYKNDGNGVFTDVTDAMGLNGPLAIGPFGIQCNFEDFNNDGYIDLLLTHRDGVPVQIYLNNGGTSLSLLNPSQITNSSSDWPIQSAATGDLNDDGYIDIYAAYATGFNTPDGSSPDVLLLNQGSGNNHLKLLLSGTSSNPDAIGARVMVYDQAWGVQVREVRSGESYGIMNSLTQHFGLGNEAVIDSIVIRWPVGGVERLTNVSANQTIKLTEGDVANALPLNWQSFRAAVEGDKRVRLDWSTSHEVGSSHFLVERTTDFANWTTIGQHEAVGSSQNTGYYFYDKTPVSGTSYYRIRQVDLDGAFTFSSTESVYFDSDAFVVFPNPASNWLNVRHPEGTDMVYSIETLAGTQVQGGVNSHDGRISLSGLKAGVYLLRAGELTRRIVVK